MCDLQHLQTVRQLLLDALLPGTIVWGANFLGVEKGTEKFPLSVKFASLATTTTTATEEDVSMVGNHGSSCSNVIQVKTHVLVGADGIWSAVRRYKLSIPRHLPKEFGTRYLGVMVILGRASIDHELANCARQK